MSSIYRYELLISEGLEEEFNKNYAEAIKKYSDAIISIPYRTCGYYFRALCYKNQLNDRSAIDDLNIAILLNPKSYFFIIERGSSMLALKEYKSALSDFNEVIKLNPNNKDAYELRAITKENLLDFEGAIDDYGIAILLNPDDHYLFEKRALVKRISGEFRGAEKDLSLAIKLYPFKADLYFKRSDIRGLKLEDYTGAINDLNRGLELEPTINPICEDLYFKEAFRKIKIDN